MAISGDPLAGPDTDNAVLVAQLKEIDSKDGRGAATAYITIVITDPNRRNYLLATAFPKPPIVADVAAVEDLEFAPPRVERPTPKDTAVTLVAETLPELRWLIEGIVPEGFSLLGGDPKRGKSFLAWNWAIAVARGEKVWDRATVAGPVLYVAIDEGRRMVRRKLIKLLDGRQAPEHLHIRFDLKRMDDGGVKQLKGWLSDIRPTFLVIDTLADFVSVPEHGMSYLKDKRSMQIVHNLAEEFDLFLLGLTHLRKEERQGGRDTDPFQDFQGTQGQSAAVDTLFVLRRPDQSADAKLFRRGRELEQDEPLALTFNGGTWEYQGIATNPPEPIIAWAQAQGGAFGPMDMAREFGMDEQAATSKIRRLIAKGLIIKLDRGRYWAIRG